MPTTRRCRTAILTGAAVAAALSSCAAHRIAAWQGRTDATAHSSFSAAYGQDADRDLMRFVPHGSQLRLSASGDLDADGDGDALLVLDDGRAGSADLPRTLRLLLRDADGRLQVAIDSPRAVPCRRCGGMAGDPLQGIRIEPGGFVLRVEGGSRELWSSEFRFAYTDSAAAWKLQSVVHTAFDRANGEQAEHALAPEDIGDVTLADFDASAFPADALP